MERNILSCLLGSSPNPRPDIEYAGRTPRGRGGLRVLSDASNARGIAKAGNGVKGKINALRAPMTPLPAFAFWQTRRQTRKAVLPALFLIIFFFALVLLHLLNLQKRVHIGLDRL